MSKSLLIVATFALFGTAFGATDRVIVKWRAAGIAAVQLPNIADRAARLEASAGQHLRAVRSMRAAVDVYKLDRTLGNGRMSALLARLNADPSVEYAEADERRYIQAAPNDPRFVGGSDSSGSWTGQWYLGTSNATTPSAVGATSAWDRATGNGIIVAVVDSGVRLDHPDLAGKFLPGRDFVCNDDPNTSCLSVAATLFLTANDSDSWDTDSSDPGDWIDATDLARADQFFAGCGSGAGGTQPAPSSWHGTRVSGILGAVTNNNAGIAGVAPDVRILPIRALGKCGGYTSDIVDGMLWAGGLTTTGGDLSSVPANPAANWAHIINLSLGSDAACSRTEQDAITALTNAGVVVVASAGNSGGPVGAPANCAGAISVSGLRHAGTKVGYSNVSSVAHGITIGAPAGNCVNTVRTLPCVYSIETTTNDGNTLPGNSFYTYDLLAPGYAGNPGNQGNVGTSFSAPIVSGVAALMVQVNPNLTVSDLTDRLKISALPFPVPAIAPPGGVCHVAADSADFQGRECQCTTATCGAGMLNAPAALVEAERPIARPTASASRASVGQSVDLDGSRSAAAAGHAIATYSWTSSPSVTIANADQPMASFVFPALRPITLTLTVTDESGRTDSQQVVVDSPVVSSGGGGGFGIELALLGLLAAARWRRPVQL